MLADDERQQVRVCDIRALGAADRAHGPLADRHMMTDKTVMPTFDPVVLAPSNRMAVFDILVRKRPIG
jgi:hypothetical protein